MENYVQKTSRRNSVAPGELSDRKQRAKYAEHEPKPTVTEANMEVTTMIADKLILEREEAKQPTIIARWESKSGKHWVTLGANGDGSYFYNAPGAYGSLGMQNSDQAAIDSFSVRVATGIFQPDTNKTPMQMVGIERIYCGKLRIDFQSYIVDTFDISKKNGERL